MGSAKPAFVEGIRTNRSGRRTYTDDFKRAIIGECREPGVSLSAVAMAHRINANLVRRWVRDRRLPDTKSKEVATLLPVTIDNPPMDGDDGGKRTKSGAGTIEVEVYGVRIRLRGGVDVASLRSVLDVLAQR